MAGVFKIIFGAAAMLGLLLVAASAAALGAFGALSFMTGPVLVLLVGGTVIVLRRRARERRDAADRATTIARRHVEDRGFRVCQGVGAQILLDATMLVIRRHGVDSFAIHGAKGDKRIPLASITAVQFREPGRRMSGYIQFSILGGVENTGGIWQASKDENTVLFTAAQRNDFAALRDLVEAGMASSREPFRNRGDASIADELAKLAALRDRGVLDATEFATQKAAVLHRVA